LQYSVLMLFDRRRTRWTAVRASDTEREHAIQALKADFTAGRLSSDELETRVEDVYDARTRWDIAVLLRGTAILALRLLVVGRLRRIQRWVLRAHLALYAAVNASLVAIWALLGEGLFWPALLIVPTSALLITHWLASRSLTRKLARRGW
jgi:hypothetical protein